MASDNIPSDARIGRRAALAFAGAAASAALLPGLAFAAQQAGHVTALFGTANAEAAGARRALAMDAAVNVDDVVSTAAESRLAMRLGQTTTVNLGALSRLKIDRYLLTAGGELNLLSGGMLYDRPPDSGPRPNTVIRSAYGLLAVRGTRFFAGMSRGVFGVFVEHGRVDVTGAGHTVLVTAGLGTNIARPGSRPTDVTRWASDRIAEALASVTQPPRR